MVLGTHNVWLQTSYHGAVEALRHGITAHLQDYSRLHSAVLRFEVHQTLVLFPPLSLCMLGLAPTYSHHV